MDSVPSYIRWSMASDAKSRNLIERDPRQGTRPKAAHSLNDARIFTQCWQETALIWNSDGWFTRWKEPVIQGSQRSWLRSCMRSWAWLREESACFMAEPISAHEWVLSSRTRFTTGHCTTMGLLLNEAGNPTEVCHSKNDGDLLSGIPTSRTCLSKSIYQSKNPL